MQYLTSIYPTTVTKDNLPNSSDSSANSLSIPSEVSCKQPVLQSEIIKHSSFRSEVLSSFISIPFSYHCMLRSPLSPLTSLLEVIYRDHRTLSLLNDDLSITPAYFFPVNQNMSLAQYGLQERFKSLLSPQISSDWQRTFSLVAKLSEPVFIGFLSRSLCFIVVYKDNRVESWDTTDLLLNKSTMQDISVGCVQRWSTPSGLRSLTSGCRGSICICRRPPRQQSFLTAAAIFEAVSLMLTGTNMGVLHMENIATTTLRKKSKSETGRTDFETLRMGREKTGTYYDNEDPGQVVSLKIHAGPITSISVGGSVVEEMNWSHELEQTELSEGHAVDYRPLPYPPDLPQSSQSDLMDTAVDGVQEGQQPSLVIVTTSSDGYAVVGSLVSRILFEALYQMCKSLSSDADSEGVVDEDINEVVMTPMRIRKSLPILQQCDYLQSSDMDLAFDPSSSVKPGVFKFRIHLHPTYDQTVYFSGTDDSYSSTEAYPRSVHSSPFYYIPQRIKPSSFPAASDSVFSTSDNDLNCTSTQSSLSSECSSAIISSKSLPRYDLFPFFPLNPLGPPDHPCLISRLSSQSSSSSSSSSSSASTLNCLSSEFTSSVSDIILHNPRTQLFLYNILSIFCYPCNPSLELTSIIFRVTKGAKPPPIVPIQSVVIPTYVVMEAEYAVLGSQTGYLASPGLKFPLFFSRPIKRQDIIVVIAYSNGDIFICNTSLNEQCLIYRSNLLPPSSPQLSSTEQTDSASPPSQPVFTQLTFDLFHRALLIGYSVSVIDILTFLPQPPSDSSSITPPPLTQPRLYFTDVEIPSSQHPLHPSESWCHPRLCFLSRLQTYHQRPGGLSSNSSPYEPKPITSISVSANKKDIILSNSTPTLHLFHWPVSPEHGSHHTSRHSSSSSSSSQSILTQPSSPTPFQFPIQYPYLTVRTTFLESRSFPKNGAVKAAFHPLAPMCIAAGLDGTIKVHPPAN